MHSSRDDGLDFFRGLRNCLLIYFVILWIVCIFMWIF
jgi:hypothetical protein